MNLPAEACALPPERARNGFLVPLQSVARQPTAVTVASEKARRYYSMILARMRPLGTGAAVAQAIGTSEATVSRAKEDLERGCAVLDALGLKIVDAKKVCVDPGEISFLRALYDRVREYAPGLLDDSE